MPPPFFKAAPLLPIAAVKPRQEPILRKLGHNKQRRAISLDARRSSIRTVLRGSCQSAGRRMPQKSSLPG